MSALAEVTNLNIEFGSGPHGTWPVRDVSFSLNPGETLCIVGESGSGKSLTGLSMMGLLPPGARRRFGEYRLLGQSLANASDRHMEDLRGKDLAMIFQEPMTSLNPSFTIGDQLTESYRRHTGATRRAAQDRAVELLEKVGIAGGRNRLRQYPHQLSGGLRQRVMIAMALMCNPKLIIADEPTTALDVTVQAQILRLLNSLQEEYGMGLILITHDLGVVAETCDEVIVMNKGRVVETGATEQIFTAPAHAYTRRLLAASQLGEEGA